MTEAEKINLSELFPEVQEFNHLKTHSAKPFIPTFEDKTWTSILYIERGNFQIEYETGEILKPKGGTFYYHPPLSLKYKTYDNMITPYSMYYLAIDCNQQNATLFSSPTLRQEIVNRLPQVPFLSAAPPLLVSAFKNIVKEYNEQNAGYLAQIENSIRQIVISTGRSDGWQKQMRMGSSSFRKKVDTFLAENKSFMGPVEELFEALDLSRSRGYEIFHETFGLNPKEYLMRKKITFAKEMLKTEMDITTIAFQLGFSSSQNFATVFKKLTCLTPSVFRKNNTINHIES